MSQRNWLREPAGVGLLVLLCVFLGFLLAEITHNYNRPNPSGYDYEAYQIDDPAITPTTILETNIANPDAYGNERKDVNQHQENGPWTVIADLWAQWIMAIGTIGILGFTGWGLFYVMRTHKASKLSLQHTGRAAIAARHQVEIAKETALQERRPWLNFTASPARDCLSPKNKRLGITLYCEMENLGRQPAIAVEEHVVLLEQGSVNFEEIDEQLRMIVQSRESLPVEQKYQGKTIFPGKLPKARATRNVDVSVVGFDIEGFLIIAYTYMTPGSDEIFYTFEGYWFGSSPDRSAGQPFLLERAEYAQRIK
jgi:hypothetical protein